MLGKLIKYEIKSSGRTFIPMYLLVLVLTPVLALILNISADSTDNIAINILSGFSMIGYVVLLIALNVCTFILVIYRFYRSMTKEPAYLTFTLPVSPRNILLSKTIVATIWQVLTFLLTIASLLAFLGILGVLDGFSLETIQCYIGQAFGISTNESISICVLLLLSILIGSILSTMEVFTAISLGQMFREHRLLLSVVFYFGIYMIMQILSMFIAIPFSLTQENSNTIDLNSFLFLFIGSLLISAIGTIAGFLLSSHMFKKKLNLE